MPASRLFDPADASSGRCADAGTWPARFRAAAAEARALVDALSPAEVHTPPAPGSWSVTQCLDHLVRTGAPLLPGLTAAVDRLQAQGQRASGPYDLGRVGRFFARSQRPGGRPLTTPRLYRPDPASSDDARPAAPPPGGASDAPAAFEALCHAYAGLAARADGLALSSIRVPSPALALLRLNVAAWMETTLAHTQRHLAQAHRAATSVAGRSSFLLPEA